MVYAPVLFEFDLYVAGIVGETDSRQHQKFAMMRSKEHSTVVPSPPPVFAARREFRDFDEFADTIVGWGLDWVQLDRGPLHAGLQQIAMSSTLLTRFRFSRKFHQRGTNPPGTRTFGLLGPTSPHMEWRGNEGAGNHIVIFPPNDEFECVSQAGFHGDAVSVSEERIRSVAEVMGVADPLEGLPAIQAIFEPDPDRAVALRSLMSRAHASVASPDGLPSAESAQSETDFEVVAALIAALTTTRDPGQRSPEPALRTRSLQLALEYIEAHADEPPTIEAIYRASGASRRTLNYGFHDQFGVSPKQYLQMTRLQRVRRDMLRSDPNAPISETAANWGFWHMGAFAADYRRQFGELPSETVRGS